MKSLIIYYFLIITPFPVLIYPVANNSIEGRRFLVLMLAYVFIYRSLTDYFRLRSKKVIDKKAFWRILVPGAQNILKRYIFSRLHGLWIDDRVAWQQTKAQG